MPHTQRPPLTVAYFTMEIALRSDIPTYAGGLGVLAGDMMRSCADLGVSATGVTICWDFGYPRQRIALDGSQHYEDVAWNPAEHMTKLPERVTVRIEGRDVTVGAWRYDLSPSQPQASGEMTPAPHNDAIQLSSHPAIPIIFLDTNFEENTQEDRDITSRLYGSDMHIRLQQEMILGIGGVRMLRALGYEEVGTFHMNEGHAALLTVELLRERGYRDEAVRPSCAFTTHTPVPAGHDTFDYDLAYRVAGDVLPWHIRNLAGQDHLSMTHLAMHLSHFTCGVSRVHGEVSRRMFPGEDIDSITNGVHHIEWCAPEMQALFETHAPGWQDRPSLLEERCRDFPDEEVWTAHQAAKQRLVDEVNRHSTIPFDADHLIIASARRVVPYKRPELIYTNLERLKEVACGRIQIIHAGSAHPIDRSSQEVIQRMIQRSNALKDCVRIAFLENYNLDLAKLLTQGADVWLNTPMRLHEASGTSGMKACLNGALNLSTLDGWWIEGYGKDPEAGWRIGPLAPAHDSSEHRKIDAEDIYTELQYQMIPEFYYKERKRWIRRMKRAIGLIGHFNTHRCVKEYLQKAWKGV